MVSSSYLRSLGGCTGTRGFVESWNLRRVVAQKDTPSDDLRGFGEEMGGHLGGPCGTLSGPEAQAATRARNISHRKSWKHEPTQVRDRRARGCGARGARDLQRAMPKEAPPRLSLKIDPKEAELAAV
jgi:hypothetical protein